MSCVAAGWYRYLQLGITETPGAAGAANPCYRVTMQRKLIPHVSGDLS